MYQILTTPIGPVNAPILKDVEVEAERREEAGEAFRRPPTPAMMGVSLRCNASEAHGLEADVCLPR